MPRQVVTKQLDNLPFRVHRMEYTLDIPAGLRCREITGEPCSTGGKQYFLDEFPVRIFPRDSFVYHDARHYGIRLNESQVEHV